MRRTLDVSAADTDHLGAVGSANPAAGRTLPLWARLVGFFAMVLLLAPLLAVALFSVNSAAIGLRWEGFTFAWYARLARDEAIRDAAVNSLLVAGASTVIATVLGVVLALALERYPWRKRARQVVETVVDLPVVTPDILFAAALVIAFTAARALGAKFENGLWTMIVGHVTFQLSFVALVVRSRLGALGHDLEEAARDLGASGWQVLWRVTLPQLGPAIAAGAVLAFTLSLDDFVISFFTSGPRSDTLPIYIYASLRRGLQPHLHALSTLLVLAAAALVLLAQQLTLGRAEAVTRR